MEGEGYESVSRYEGRRWGAGMTGSTLLLHQRSERCGARARGTIPAPEGERNADAQHLFSGDLQHRLTCGIWVSSQDWKAGREPSVNQARVSVELNIGYSDPHLARPTGIKAQSNHSSAALIPGLIIRRLNVYTGKRLYVCRAR